MNIGIKEIPDLKIICSTKSGKDIELNIHTASSFSIAQKHGRIEYNITSCVLPKIFWDKVIPEYNNKNILNFWIKTETLARVEDGTDIDFSFPEIKLKYMNYTHTIKDCLGITSITFFDDEEDINE